MTTKQIAMVCHEANRVYCDSIKDSSQLSWTQAPEWQRVSAIRGVQFHLDNPDAGPSDSHQNWLKEKEDAGWVNGPIKDAALKQHPCCVPYDALPEEQQVKDTIFIGIVDLFRDMVTT